MDKRNLLLAAAGLLAMLALIGWLLLPEQIPASTPHAAETPAPPEDTQVACTLAVDLPDPLGTSLPLLDPGTSVEDPLCLEQRAGDLDLQPAAAGLPGANLGPVES